jgi:uncharacterized membrane protein YraQ (UPF0718 family)
MIEAFQREWIYLWYYFSVLFEQIFKYWAIGVLIGSAVSEFGKQGINSLIERLQRRKLGALGIIPASILGIASPLCMYGTIPIAAAFSNKGMKDDLLAAFMMSSILLNPQLIVYSATLGAKVLVIRVLSCLLCGIAAGLLVRALYTSRGKSFFTFSGFEKPKGRDTAANPAMRLLFSILRNVRITGPYFLLGISLSAAFQRYVPENFIVSLFGRNKAFGVLIAATMGVPLYACGGGTIPLLQTWLADGMSLGAAAAFMITGPATKITNLGAMKIVLGGRRFSIYMAFGIAFAVLIGILVNLAL